MPLDKQPIVISLTGGIDRKTDPKQLSNGQMYTADNVQYVTEKQIRKRFGYNTLTPPGGLQGAPFAAVGCRDNIEPVVLGTGALNRINTKTGLSTYIPANTQGEVSSYSITSSSGSGLKPSPPIDASIATDGQKYMLVTWQEYNGSTYQVNGYPNIYYGVQDLQTGAWIISPSLLTNIDPTPLGDPLVDTTAPQALYINGYFMILLGEITQSTSTSKYNYYVASYSLPLTNLQSGFVGGGIVCAISTGLGIAQQKAVFCGWDAQIYKNSIVVVYQNPTGASNSITQIFLDGTAQKTTTFSLPSGSYGSFGNQYRMALSTAGPDAYPFTVVTPNYSYVFNADLTLRGGGGSHVSVLNPMATVWLGTTAYWFYEASTPTGLRIAYTTSIGTAGYVETPCSSQQAGIASRPWTYNGRIYFWQFVSGYAGSGTFRCYVLTEFDPSANTTSFVARTAYQDAWIANFGTMQNPCDVVQIPGTNKWVTILPQTTDAYGGIPATSTSNPTYTSTYYGNLARAEFDFTPSKRPQLVSMPSGGLFVAGAFPLQYDGQTLSEAGFSVSPELISSPGASYSAPAVSSTGGAIAAGTYYYYLCFVRRDAYGNVIRSSPSIAYLVNVTSSTGKVTFPAMSYEGAANTYIEIYRTTIASPSEPYYVGRTALGVAFTDSFSDANIVTNFNLYTYSGEYPNDPPPAVFSIAFGETRGYIIPADARNTIWCSKKYTPGRSVEWTSNLILTEGGTNNGQFTAVAVLDTNVIVFKQDSIIYFNGDGPDNAGATGSFSSFQKLSSDVGCIDPGSLAIIPNGLLFRSQRGIELLTRGLQVQYIGFPVEPLVQAITTIGSACVLPKYQQVRFVPINAGEPVLVYDYLGNRWSTYSSMASVSCANVMGNYWWISTDGTQCNVETPGTFLDNGNFIPMTLETPEITMQGVQGWGRLYRFSLLGEYKSAHTLTTSFAYDHAETYTDVVTYSAYDASIIDPLVPDAMYYDATSNQKADLVVPPCPEQFRMSRVPRQVMQTVRFMLQDGPFNGYYMSDGSIAGVTVPYGEGCAISNITLEVGQKAIIAKLPGRKTV